MTKTWMRCLGACALLTPAAALADSGDDQLNDAIVAAYESEAVFDTPLSVDAMTTILSGIEVLMTDSGGPLNSEMAQVIAGMSDGAEWASMRDMMQGGLTTTYGFVGTSVDYVDGPSTLGSPWAEASIPPVNPLSSLLTLSDPPTHTLEVSQNTNGTLRMDSIWRTHGGGAAGISRTTDSSGGTTTCGSSYSSDYKDPNLGAEVRAEGHDAQVLANTAQGWVDSGGTPAEPNPDTPSTEGVDGYRPDDTDGGLCPLTIPHCYDAYEELVANGATADAIIRGTIYLAPPDPAVFNGPTLAIDPDTLLVNPSPDADTTDNASGPIAVRFAVPALVLPIGPNEVTSTQDILDSISSIDGL